MNQSNLTSKVLLIFLMFQAISFAEVIDESTKKDIAYILLKQQLVDAELVSPRDDLKIATSYFPLLQAKNLLESTFSYGEMDINVITFEMKKDNGEIVTAEAYLTSSNMKPAQTIQSFYGVSSTKKEKDLLRFQKPDGTYTYSALAGSKVFIGWNQYKHIDGSKRDSLKNSNISNTDGSLDLENGTKYEYLKGPDLFQKQVKNN